MNRQNIINALRAFVAQRPSLEFVNYGDVSAYRSELRQITKTRHESGTLLSAIGWRHSLTAEHILEAGQRNFSGRLKIVCDGDKVNIDYRVDQYRPTEYRKAVASVCSGVLWDYWRENALVDAGVFEPHSNPHNVGNYIRKTARRELGRSIAKKYFN